MTGDRIKRYLDQTRDDQGEFCSLSSALLDAFVRAGFDEDLACERELEKALCLLPPDEREAGVQEYKRGISLCESPIERRLFPWLIFQAYNCFEPRHPCVLLPGESEKLKPCTVAVIPQLPIGRRRADFALAARRDGPIRFVIVECDGEEFHKDVEKDIARDAEFMRLDRVLDVHPITGKEIHRNAEAAALGANRALTTAWAKTNKLTRHKFGAAP
jgi:very-short-patch-repair endonuclease